MRSWLDSLPKELAERVAFDLDKEPAEATSLTDIILTAQPPPKRKAATSTDDDDEAEEREKKKTPTPKPAKRRRKETIAKEKTREFFKVVPDYNIDPSLDNRSVEDREERGIINISDMTHIKPAHGWDPLAGAACARYFDSFDLHSLYLPDPTKAHQWVNKYAKVPKFWDYVALLRTWVLEQPVDLLLDKVKRTNPSLISVIETAEKKKWKARIDYGIRTGEPDPYTPFEPVLGSGSSPIRTPFEYLMVKIKGGPATTLNPAFQYLQQPEGTGTGKDQCTRRSDTTTSSTSST